MVGLSMDNITCPHCGKSISDALKAQIEQEVLRSSEADRKKELDAVRKEAQAQSEKKIKEQFDMQLKHATEEASEKDARIKELLEQMSKMMGDFRELKRERDETKIEMQKKLAEEEGKIRQDAQKKAEEEQQLKISEKDKQLQTALKEVEEMRRKLQQGSQQAQGEVFEEEFEKSLAAQYPNDTIEPVGKGIRGGDIVQEVIDGRGNSVGKILWELKNTKTWSELWIEKLKSDRRTINAEEAVIITLAMPAGIKNAGFKDQVWVTNREFVIPLADALRAKMIHVFHAKRSVEGKSEKIEFLYSYLSGTHFKHRVEAIVEAFSNMQGEIEKEKRYFMNKWARDEKNIRQVIDNTYGMHGDLKGIIGSSLPAIAGIEDEELGVGLDQNSEIITRRDGISLTLKQQVKSRTNGIIDQPTKEKVDDTDEGESQTLF
jgi:hypothetical protein